MTCWLFVIFDEADSERRDDPTRTDVVTVHIAFRTRRYGHRVIVVGHFHPIITKIDNGGAGHAHAVGQPAQVLSMKVYNRVGARYSETTDYIQTLS
jgi:hypothetical protein